jgi:hypothetical protein|tara:strand:+ start:929 stop:1111 length:183 start_codon:yes stop_codon:yes gene_type:complete
LGKVLRDLTNLIGVKDVSFLLGQKLEKSVQLAQANPDNVFAWMKIHGVLTAFEQVARVVK